MVAFEAAPDDLGDRGHVVGASVTGGLPDAVAAVVGLPWQSVLEHHQAGDDVGALDVGDVGALDAQRRIVHPQGLLQFLQRGRAGGEVTGAGDLVLAQGLGRVGGRGLHERAFVTALGHAQGHPRTA